MNARFRGWTQFSLCATLLLMLVVGVFFCGYRVGHSKGRYERSRSPNDSFDDLIALICETIQPTTGKLWIITDPDNEAEESQTPTVVSRPVNNMAPDDPFGSVPAASEPIEDPFK